MRKGKSDSRTLQNTFKSLENSSLLLKIDKKKHTTTYVVPLISTTKGFTDLYMSLNV
jgi:hypothetical protein